MKIRLLGKCWNFSFGRVRLKGTVAHCDSPDTPNKEIIVSSRLRGEAQLDAVIHELLHAADWHKTEEWVDQVGTDLARALYRLGWRKVE